MKKQTEKKLSLYLTNNEIQEITKVRRTKYGIECEIEDTDTHMQKYIRKAFFPYQSIMSVVTPSRHFEIK